MLNYIEKGGNKMKQLRPKKRGTEIEIKTFRGKSGQTYIVFKTKKGSYHVFQEVEAKAAAKDCGATTGKNTRQMWDSIF